MQVEIDGAAVSTPHDFHQQIKSLLALGEYYGCNLDALWDFLATEVERPVHLIWSNSELSSKRLGQEYFERIVAIFEAVKEADVKAGWSAGFTFELR